MPCEITLSLRTPRREFTEFLDAVSHIGVPGPGRRAGAAAAGLTFSRYRDLISRFSQGQR